MTTETLTITAFVLERLDEWEREANKAGSFTPWDRDFERDNYGQLLVQPGIILATCKAHRAIVEGCRVPLDVHLWEYQDDQDAQELALLTLRALASIWADHDSYDARWAL